MQTNGCWAHWPQPGALCALATMHAKEAVIGPLLADEFSLVTRTVREIDTDQFGTFSHDVQRRGDQLQAARAKIQLGLEMMPSASIGLASEGSFGPAPFGFLPMAREIVVLLDRESGLELIGRDNSLDTNFSHAIVESVDAALTFASRIGFPTHGVIALGWRDERPAPSAALHKNVWTEEDLARTVVQIIEIHGRALIETDMRANRNPTRMNGIARATRDLLRLMRSRCPSCETPGYDVVEIARGLPCELCGCPTRMPVEKIFRCASCAHVERRRATMESTADASYCDDCNP